MWGPAVCKSTHPVMQWKSLKLLGNVLSLKGANTGNPIELDSGGFCEDDQMRAGTPRSQWRGTKIL
jgi:hypothetical protein